MLYTKTKAVDKILSLRKRLKIIQGGSSAGKTIAILLIFIDRAQNEPGKLFSVVSETLPHLKKGAIRDFLNIMEGHGYYNDNNWNRTDFIYTFESGAKIEFFSADSPDKVRGPRRDVLFINEANNISYETYTQLAIRTNEEIYIDYNPVAEFWAHDDIINNLDRETGEPLVDHDFLIVTYKDNDALPETIVKDLESRMNKPGWWKVYGEGLLGEAEGVIYPRWRQIDGIPEGARLERYGLDFGYSNDPTAIVAIYYYDGGYILDEILFQKGLSNKQIADTLLAQEKKALVIADAAEPKSIDEIRSYGVNIQPAVKGQGSVLQGIQIVQDQDISITKRSVNGIKANKNYVWDTDMDGKPTNLPDHFWSDFCFPAGTKVEGGNIEDVGFSTGTQDVYEYEIGGDRLIATENHPVMTNRGLVPIDAVRYNDVIWKNKSSFIRASGGQDIRTVLIGITAVTLAVVSRIIEAAGRHYTDSSGKKRTDLSRLGIIFITLTRIPLIMLWITYGVRSALNTSGIIGRRKSVNWAKKVLSQLSNALLSGQRLQMASNAGARWERQTPTSCTTYQQSQGTATCVEKNTKRSSTDTTDSATSIADKRRYVGHVPVYNQRTRSGMYLANGLLVSNCDAVRYGMASIVPLKVRQEMIRNLPRMAETVRKNPAR